MRSSFKYNVVVAAAFKRQNLIFAAFIKSSIVRPADFVLARVYFVSIGYVIDISPVFFFTLPHSFTIKFTAVALLSFDFTQIQILFISSQFEFRLILATDNPS